MRKVIVLIIALSMLGGCFVGFAACGKTQREDVITIRNVYFDKWSAQQGDTITQKIEEQFGITFETSTYNYEKWSEGTNSDIFGNVLPDVFQANVKPENFDNTYKYWIDGENVKALPDELLSDTKSERWPYLQKMLKETRDIESLLYDGKLYGIPVSRNINREEDVDFAPFTYIYRRDIAKNFPSFQSNDEYTWAQFEALLQDFKDYFKKNGINGYAIGDENWGYSSILNYYKTASHCFTYDEAGIVVNNYNTNEYWKGLKKVESYVNKNADKGGKGFYHQGQMGWYDLANQAKVEYYSGRMGVYYDNFSFTNYLSIRDQMLTNNTREINAGNIDDATAFLKVTGPSDSYTSGKYVLEEQEDWFSMTFLNYDISDAKMEKILDIMNWLISPEGTLMALYGIEGVDYIMDEYGEVELLSTGDLWEKNAEGEYSADAVSNGAKYLRYMVTLGRDIAGLDPTTVYSDTKSRAYEIWKNWEDFMSEQEEHGNLIVLKEDPSIKWMKTPNKLHDMSTLQNAANKDVLNYTFGEITEEKYRSDMTSKTWEKVLKEINDTLAAEKK